MFLSILSTQIHGKMSSAVIPQWKVALQQKLDKKKDDERRKLHEQEERRLDALPPWKRMGMVPNSVIIISGGTKTVSKLASESSTNNDMKQEVPTGSKSTKAGSLKSGFVGGSSSTTLNTSNRSENRIISGNAKQNRVSSSGHDGVMTNNVGVDEHDGGRGMKKVAEREGVDEEHVSSVFDNPFLKLDGGKRKRRISATKIEDSKSNGNVSQISDHQTICNDVGAPVALTSIIAPEPTVTVKPRESVIMTKKEPDNNIRQRSRSASPRHAAEAHGVDLKSVEAEELPKFRVRKSSVSDLRNKFGHPASIEDLTRVSRKLSESEEGSPRSPRSPTTVLDRTKLFSLQPHNVHFTGKLESPNKLSPTSTSGPFKVPVPNSFTSDSSASTHPETRTNSDQENTSSKQSESKPVPVSVTQAKVGSVSGDVITSKRQAPKAPVTSDSSLSRQKDISPAVPKADDVSSGGKSQSVVKIVNNSAESNKPIESSNISNASNHKEQPDQPKTAIIVDDGQSSLRRKRGTGKMSASALISLSSDKSAKDNQLSDHNSRIRAARQEARSSNSKNLLRSARDGEDKDTASIPSGAVSSSMFGHKKEKMENHSTSATTTKDEAPYVDAIPYPTNFRQPKAKSDEASEEKAPSTKLVSYSRSVNETIDEIPRTNIDEVILSPNLVNGRVEEKAAPKKIKKSLDLEWIGFNSPTGTPSSLKATSITKYGRSPDNKKVGSLD